MTNNLYFTYTTEIRFDETVEAGYMKHYIPIPTNVAQQFVDKDIKHVEGTLNDTDYRRVLHMQANGDYCLKFGLSWLQQAGLDVGDSVTVILYPDPDPERVDLPEELSAELQLAPPQVMEAWANLSTSMQKTLAYGVARAKQSATRQRRSRKIIQDLIEENNLEV